MKHLLHVQPRSYIKRQPHSGKSEWHMEGVTDLLLR